MVVALHVTHRTVFVEARGTAPFAGQLAVPLPTIPKTWSMMTIVQEQLLSPESDCAVVLDLPSHSATLSKKDPLGRTARISCGSL